MRCRDDLRCARTAARHRVLKQLLRHGRIFRDGKSHWTLMHRRWVARSAWMTRSRSEALEQMLIHLDGIERQLDTLDARLERDRSRRALGRPGAAPHALPRDLDA